MDVTEFDRSGQSNLSNYSGDPWLRNPVQNSESRTAARLD